MNRKMRTMYPPEFKLEAVKRAKVGDRAVRRLEQELGMSQNLLRQWIQQYDAQGAGAFVRKTSATMDTAIDMAVAGEGDEVALAAEQRVTWLQKRLAQREGQIAQMERDLVILKKALALLSQDQR